MADITELLSSKNYTLVTLYPFSHHQQYQKIHGAEDPMLPTVYKEKL